MKRIITLFLLLLTLISCSPENIAAFLDKISGNVLGDAPVDASSITDIAGNAEMNEITVNNNSITFSGKGGITISGLSISEDNSYTIISGFDDDDIAAIASALETAKNSGNSSLAEALSEEADEDSQEAVKSTLSLYSEIISNITGNGGDEIISALNGLFSLGEEEGYTITVGDVLVMQAMSTMMESLLSAAAGEDQNINASELNLDDIDYTDLITDDVITSISLLINICDTVDKTQDEGTNAINPELLGGVMSLYDAFGSYLGL